MYIKLHENLHMLKSILIVFLSLISSVLFAQTTLLDDNFETNSGIWSLSGTTSTNSWINDNCAGNGTSASGTNSFYISDLSPGCGSTGNESFAYSDAASGSEFVIASTSINAFCLSNLVLNFDYRNDAIGDNAELVYSTNGGTNWVTIGANYNSASWASASLTLPTTLEGNNFLIGFRFTYNSTESSQLPFSFDNITLTGEDNLEPTILCPLPTNVYVNASCDAMIMDYRGLVTSVDNCLGGIIISQTPAAGFSVTSADNDILITLIATDAAGNSNQCSFNQPIIDTVIPTITCPPTVNLYTNSNCEATIGDYIPNATGSDNCTATNLLTFIQSPPANSIIGTSTTASMMVTDESGNQQTCSFTIKVADTISPTVVCPPTQTFSTNSMCEYILADISGLAVGSDNCTQPISLTYFQTPAAGTLLPVGTNVITITVNDTTGNNGTCQVDVNVEDQVAPSITMCAPNQNIYTDVNCEATIGDYTSLIATNDNCSAFGDLTFSQNPIPGTSVTVTTLVTMSVEDENGNIGTCQFSTLFTDTVQPAPICPADFTIAINSSCQYTLPDITGSVTGSDNCSSFANLTITQNPAPGTTDFGVTPILISMMDESGVIGTCITTITPIDLTPPTVTCPTITPVDNGANCDYILPNYGALTLVLDDCPNYSIVQDPPFSSTVQPGTTPITIDVTDAGGNMVTCSFDLVVTENVAPIITCPTDVSTCNPIVTFTDPTVTDNCFSFFNQTDATGFSSGDIFPIGITTLQYEGLDSSGNSNTCSFNIEVLDFPSSGNITLDTLKLCDATSTVLNADPITSGTGLWSVLNGSGSFNNQFASSTGVNGLQSGINQFIWTVSSAGCGSLSDTIVVLSAQEPLPASVPNDTIISCFLNTIDLVSNGLIDATGLWTTTGDATIIQADTNVTKAIIQSSGWTEFIWTVSNGVCPSTSDTIHVFSNLMPSILTNDTTFCYSNDASLFIEAEVAPNDINSQWSALGNSIVFDTPNADETNASGFKIGKNTIIYSTTNFGCPELKDTLIVVVNSCGELNPVFPTVITPNYDGKNDVFFINDLQEIYPDIHVTIFNRWGSLIYESFGYDKPWDGTTKGEDLPMGTYFYKIELNDSNNTIFTGDISIIR